MKLNRKITMAKPNHAKVAFILAVSTIVFITLFFTAALIIGDTLSDNRYFYSLNYALLVGAVMAGIWGIKTKRI